MKVRVRKQPDSFQEYEEWHVECKYWWWFMWINYTICYSKAGATKCAQELVNPIIIEFT